jgi:hypothetical protein
LFLVEIGPVIQDNIASRSRLARVLLDKEHEDQFAENLPPRFAEVDWQDGGNVPAGQSALV